MGTKGCKGVALSVVGLAGVNFFYVYDLLIGQTVITLGPKSLAAIGVANLVSLIGLFVTAKGPCASEPR
jgi:hypothetical protein